ncbi:MAG TPA: TolC family protein [Phycisphaerae bacterium]|nr:TolC family protein [Phycisphaerae bacterium]
MRAIAVRSLLLAGLTAVAGCLSPGELEVTRLTRYQQAMAARAARTGPRTLADPLRPAAALAVPDLPEDRVVERLTETTRTYSPPADANAQEPQDRISTVVVMTDFDLDAGTGQPDPKTARASRRTETETTRFFRRVRDPRAVPEVSLSLTRTVSRRTELARSAQAGRLVRHAEIVTTSTYRKLPAPTTAPADAEAEPQVRVETVTSTTRFLRPESDRPEAVEHPEAVTSRMLPVWQYEELGRRPWTGRTTTQKSARRARAGQVHEQPALLTTTRRLIGLDLAQAVQLALAANPDIRVVSFDPEVTREEMVKAAAAFDAAVFLHTNFRKEEGGNPALGLIDDARRIRMWEAGLYRRTPTGATWMLRSELSRNWDSSALDGMYKSIAAVEVTQPLLRNAWPAFNLAALRVARLSHKTSHAQFRAAVEQVVTEVTDAYWRLVQARRTVEIQQDLLEMTRQTLAQIHARLNLDATRASVEQARATLRRREADLVDAKRDVGDAQDRLAHLAPVGPLRTLRDAEVVSLTAPLDEKLHLDPTEQLMTAVRHSPLLEEARLAIAAARVNIVVAENQTLPVLDLRAAMQVERSNPSVSGHWDVTSRPDESALGYELDLLLDYPIGNRAARAQLRQARFQHTQSIASMQKTINDLALAINEQVRAMDRMHEKVVALRDAITAAEAELDAVLQSERTEIRITPQVLRTRLRAQENLARSRWDFEEALADYNIARAELNRITGTVLDLNGVRIELPSAAGQDDAPEPDAPPEARAPRR